MVYMDVGVLILRSHSNSTLFFSSESLCILYLIMQFKQHDRKYDLVLLGATGKATRQFERSFSSQTQATLEN